MSLFEDYRAEEPNYLTPGDYWVAITAVEETVSRTSGNPMLVVTVQPGGSDLHIKHYIVKNQYFNRNITELFDSFGIQRGNGNILEWIGAVGAAKLVEDENGYLRVRRFLPPERQKSLPPWQGELPQRQQVDDGYTEIAPEEDLPF